MKNCHLLKLFAVVAALTGCITAPQKHQMTTAFSEAEFAPYMAEGSATIKGQAFLKTRGGEVRYAAGNEVLLIPVTSYSREIWQAAKQGKITDKDRRWENVQRKTVADGSGNFEFNKLPAGEYFLECSIFWEVPSGSIMRSTGAVVKKEVKVANDETLKVILTE